MSRTALVSTFVVVVAGLSGCASPAKVIRQDSTSVVVAVPDNTNTWPFYHRDEATRAAGEFIHDPVLVSTARIKVGEQLTNTQDMTRRDLGKDKKVGEVVSSTNTSSVTDNYEFHLEFRSRGPVTMSTSGAGAIPASGAANGVVVPAGGAPAAGMPPTGMSNGVSPPATPGLVPPGGPSLSLPPTKIGTR